MVNYIRRLVSGAKARHVDHELNADLDLCYVTDRLIIMGWPASSFEALYRNSRKEVRRFLDKKHGEKYRVYNLCPCTENRYGSGEFYDAVSRYPFPDHHVPPLSMIPMFVADITAYLAEDVENVAVIHCKAGKGRSGTMACCYLVSLPILPSPPQDERNWSSKEKKALLQSQNSAIEPGLPSQQIQRGASDDELAKRAKSSQPDVASVSKGADNEARARDAPWLEPYLTKSPTSNIDPTHGMLLAPSHLEIGKREGPKEETTRESQPSSQSSREKVKEYDIEAVAERLRAVFELHTSRRLKPAKTSSGLKGEKSSSNLQNQERQQKEPRQMHQGQSTSPSSKSWRRPSFGSSLAAKLSRQSSNQTSQGRERNHSFANYSSNTQMKSYNGTNGTATHRTASQRRQSNVEMGSRPNMRALGVNPGGRSCIDLHSAGAMYAIDRTLPRSPTPRAGADPWSSSSSFQTTFDSSMLSPSLLNSSPTRAGVSQLAPEAQDVTARKKSPLWSPSASSIAATIASNRRPSIDEFARSSIPTPKKAEHQSLRMEGSSIEAYSPAPEQNELSDAHQSQGMSRSTSSGLFDPSSDSNIAMLGSSKSGSQAHLEGQIEDEETSKGEEPRLAVSIPSQRRWVGYWARMLASQDPRACLDPFRASSRRRLVRITRVYVDRRMTAKDSNGDPSRAAASGTSSSSSPNGSSPDFGNGLIGSVDNLSIQLGRYDEQLVSRVEDWERSARRRARAYGMLDPSDVAPELAPASWEKDSAETEGLSKRRRERMQKEDDDRWEQCGRKNSEARTDWDKRLAQHGNDRGVGQWGINVLGEADRIRNFEWNDDERTRTKESGGAGEGKAEGEKSSNSQIQYFGLVPEARRQILHGQQALSTMSTVDLEGTKDATDSLNRSTIKRYIFEPGNDVALRNATDASPWASKSKLSLENRDAQGETSGLSSTNILSKVTDTIRVTKKKSRAALRRTPQQQSDSDSGPSTPPNADANLAPRLHTDPYLSRDRQGDVSAIDFQALQKAAETEKMNVNSDPSSTFTSRMASASNRSSGSANVAATSSGESSAIPSDRGPSFSSVPTSTASLPHAGKGVLVDADRELLVKVLWGRTGTTHAKLPDWSSAGWVWMIPSFEDPMCCQSMSSTSSASGNRKSTKKVRVGMRTEARFEQQDIDFRKKGATAPGGEVRAIGIEWEWVDVGEEDDVGSTDDEEVLEDKENRIHT